MTTVELRAERLETWARRTLKRWFTRWRTRAAACDAIWLTIDVGVITRSRDQWETDCLRIAGERDELLAKLVRIERNGAGC